MLQLWAGARCGWCGGAGGWSKISPSARPHELELSRGSAAAVRLVGWIVPRRRLCTETRAASRYRWGYVRACFGDARPAVYDEDRRPRGQRRASLRGVLGREEEGRVACSGRDSGPWMCGGSRQETTGSNSPRDRGSEETDARAFQPLNVQGCPSGVWAYCSGGAWRRRRKRLSRSSYSSFCPASEGVRLAETTLHLISSGRLIAI